MTRQLFSTTIMDTKFIIIYLNTAIHYMNLAFFVMMDEIKSQHEATHQLLQDVLARLGPAQVQNVQDPLLTHPARQSPMLSIPTSSAGWKKLALKPFFPPEFKPPERPF